ncbi:chorismate--pyruvate lyase family protein [Thalassotalea piscium]
MFPVNLQTQWYNADFFALDENLSNWLLDENSLTARLKKCCQQFRVQLLGQQIEPCHPKEANQDIKAGEKVLVREVLLLCDDKPHVFARTLIPLRSLTGVDSQLADLGEQSLGQFLFNQPQLCRKDIEISMFDKHSPVYSLVLAYQLPDKKELWGRRSVFMLGEKPLMVAEVFLPGAYAYNEEKK